MTENRLLCGVICADDPKGEHPCVNAPKHGASPHKDSRGYTWGVSNSETAESADASPLARMLAARRAEHWRGVIASRDDDDGDEL